jgi:predicted methyltransferase
LFSGFSSNKFDMFHKKNKLPNAINRGFFTALLVILATTVSCAQSAKDNADWLIDVLDISEGSVVAEMGAGDGSLTLALAEGVGPEGQIYSSELGADSVQYLQDVVDSAPASNVTVVQGQADQTNFPGECCNALFMRRVYHHFKDPSAMNQSILESLKPGGRLAIIDFAPRSTESTDPADRASGQHHGVTEDTVVKELKEAGFTLVSSERKGRNVYVVMQKKERE